VSEEKAAAVGFAQLGAVGCCEGGGGGLGGVEDRVRAWPLTSVGAARMGRVGVLTFAGVLGGVDSCHEGRALVDRAMLVRPLKVHGRRRATVGARHDGGEAEQGTADDKDRVAQEGGGGRKELGCVRVKGAVGYDDLLETAINKPEPEVRTSDVAVRCSGATVRVGWLVCSVQCAVCGGRCAVLPRHNIAELPAPSAAPAIADQPGRTFDRAWRLTCTPTLSA
jgi:hypothetical protein